MLWCLNDITLVQLSIVTSLEYSRKTPTRNNNASSNLSRHEIPVFSVARHNDAMLACKLAPLVAYVFSLAALELKNYTIYGNF